MDDQVRKDHPRDVERLVHIAHVEVEVGQVLDISPGHGRWRISTDPYLVTALRLVAASDNEPTTVIAEVGSVIHVRDHGSQMITMEQASQSGQVMVGHGYQMVNVRRATQSGRLVDRFPVLSRWA
jgi:hypothetical protein